MIFDPWALVLALARVAPLMVVAPVAAGLPLPRVAQIALAVVVAAVVASGLDAGALAAAGWPARIVMVGREALIGAVLGAVAAVPLAAASAAGAWIADEAGGLFELAAATVFFGVGGHLMVVEALGLSYRALPVGTAPRGGLEVLGVAGAQMIAAGVALAAPIIVAGLLAALVVGAVERLAGVSSALVPELAVRRVVMALAGAAAVFALAMAVAGHTRALPAALAAAIERLG